MKMNGTEAAVGKCFQNRCQSQGRGPGNTNTLIKISSSPSLFIFRTFFGGIGLVSPDNLLLLNDCLFILRFLPRYLYDPLAAAK